MIPTSIPISAEYISTTRTNYLIVQLLNAGLTSSDLLFDVSLSIDKTETTSPTNAIEYTGPITINDYSLITSRVFVDDHGPFQGYVRSGDDWSPPTTSEFFVNAPASSDNVVISEINYNPTGPTPEEIAAGFDNDDDFEFIELWNTSSVCLLYTSPSPRDATLSRMPSSA